MPKAIDRVQKNQRDPKLDISGAAISGPSRAPDPLMRMSVPEAPTIWFSGVQSRV